jgi:hypothetical protein
MNRILFKQFSKSIIRRKKLKGIICYNGSCFNKSLCQQFGSCQWQNFLILNETKINKTLKNSVVCYYGKCDRPGLCQKFNLCNKLNY